jgi:hypothetical protein
VFGKIKTVHRGYIGSQDTFYIDSLEYLRRVCQQTYFYRYSKVAHAKLYITQTPITAAAILLHRTYQNQGKNRRKPTVCVNAATRRSCKNYIRLHSPTNSINPSMHFRPVWINDWINTILSKRIRVKSVSDEYFGRP